MLHLIANHIIVEIFCCCLETTLNPVTLVFEVCPGENNTLSCTEKGTAHILWNWNDIIIMREYKIAGIDNNNTTCSLLSNNNMMMLTRLMSTFL